MKRAPTPQDMGLRSRSEAECEATQKGLARSKPKVRFLPEKGFYRVSRWTERAPMLSQDGTCINAGVERTSLFGPFTTLERAFNAYNRRIGV